MLDLLNFDPAYAGIGAWDALWGFGCFALTLVLNRDWL